METKAAKLEGILRLAVTAIITIDHRGLIEIANPATERLFRLPHHRAGRAEREGSDA